MIDKKIIEGNLCAFIELFMWDDPFSTQVVPQFFLDDREKIHIETAAIRESLSMLASGAAFLW